jgi:hypothetical protein
VRRKPVIHPTGQVIEKIQEQFAKLDEVIASLQQLEAEVKTFFPKHKGKHRRKFMHQNGRRKSGSN